MENEGNIRVNWLDWLSLALVIIGALNWGLVGLGTLLAGSAANWNVVNQIFGSVPTIEALIYLLVGLAGLYELYFAYQLARESGERTTTERPA